MSESIFFFSFSLICLVHVLADIQSPWIMKDPITYNPILYHCFVYTLFFTISSSWLILIIGLIPWIAFNTLAVLSHHIVDMIIWIIPQKYHLSKHISLIIDQAIHYIFLILIWLLVV